MNLSDPELELLDPTPNIHSLFVHFDSLFFWAALVGRALVRWSKRMYSCAGICSYEGKNGVCDIALSEPLLKLRPRKDLVETLLHEMIHAFLFITNKDNDRDGHGPNFQAHMHRINRAAGLNISIYHNFHNEVNVYLKHWWRCNGPCQKLKPFFGIVRRTVNRAPGPTDFWWDVHHRTCAGTFIKIKEPEKKQKQPKKVGKAKNVADITKYINNNNNKIVNKNVDKFVDVAKKVINNVQADNVEVPSPSKPVQTVNVLKVDDNRPRSNSNTVIEKVRNVWLNKQLPTINNPVKTNQPTLIKSTKEPTANKHKAVSPHVDSPPKKLTKIDDYFKANAILKDIYGKNITLTQPSDGKKLKAVTDDSDGMILESAGVEDLVSCPSCNAKVKSEEINRHLDECLNKDIIEELTKETIIIPSTSQIDVDRRSKEVSPTTSQTIERRKSKDVAIEIQMDDKSNLKETVGAIEETSPFRFKNHADDANITYVKTIKQETSEERMDPSKSTVTDERDSDLIIPKIEKDETKPFKSEPGTSKGNSVDQMCPCCDKKVDKPIEVHLDECLVFFNNNSTIPEEGASGVETIVIDDDVDEFDETLTLNATGTKSPCPCCLKMVEIADMNEHLDVCLST